MKESKRETLRTLSVASATLGIMLMLACAGTSDFRNELQYADEDTRNYYEKQIISQKTEDRLTAASFGMMVAGAAGMLLTEKKQKQR